MNTIIETALQNLRPQFNRIEKIALSNQQKVLQAFASNQVALRHFAPTSGYGSDDVGRDTLGKVVAEIFGAESGIMSPLIVSGTHALTLGLFGILRPGDKVLSVCGMPYDTLQDVIFKHGVGSLADFGVTFECVDLQADGQFNFEAIGQYLAQNSVKMVYLQRSRGYAWRSALSIAQIAELCKFVRKIAPHAVIFCDNCYGEFVEEMEPTNVGVDVCAGSCIKNIGGGIAPTGGYVVGKQSLIDMVAGRLTSPSIGMEVGSYAGGYRLFYQGLFLAPHVVSQALKGVVTFSYVLSQKGYDVLPKFDGALGDIVCSVQLGSADKLIKFCQAVQAASPVDGFVSPEPWQMPGYNDKVIMAAGAFVQGSSIELSCDGPLREPYVAYLQGGITFEHAIIALDNILSLIG